MSTERQERPLPTAAMNAAPLPHMKSATRSPSVAWRWKNCSETRPFILFKFLKGLDSGATTTEVLMWEWNLDFDKSECPTYPTRTSSS